MGILPSCSSFRKWLFIMLLTRVRMSTLSIPKPCAHPVPKADNPQATRPPARPRSTFHRGLSAFLLPEGAHAFGGGSLVLLPDRLRQRLRADVIHVHDSLDARHLACVCWAVVLHAAVRVATCQRHSTPQPGDAYRKHQGMLTLLWLSCLPFSNTFDTSTMISGLA